MNRSINLIGDELQIDGVVVAVLAQSGVPATVMDDFTHGLSNGTLFEGDEYDECDCTHKEGCVHHRAEKGTQKDELEEDDRDVLLRLLERRSKNGLLRLTDACSVVNEFMDGELE